MAIGKPNRPIHGERIGLVIERDHAPQDVIDALPSPVGGYQIQLAPVVIVWFPPTRSGEVGSFGSGGALSSPSAQPPRSTSPVLVTTKRFCTSLGPVVQPVQLSPKVAPPSHEISFCTSTEHSRHSLDRLAKRPTAVGASPNGNPATA